MNLKKSIQRVGDIKFSSLDQLNKLLRSGALKLILAHQNKKEDF